MESHKLLEGKHSILIDRLASTVWSNILAILFLFCFFTWGAGLGSWQSVALVFAIFGFLSIAWMHQVSKNLLAISDRLEKLEAAVAGKD